ncbi:hypothetical protein DEO72_LG10g2583 [Vigna unguiculata]|uniref:Uncharacterized protein n=1 Tax=Vigna unguiculata TaxID=3917 RepID=A0A4D6NBU8_VIGUN|nr:hypothetical protein DEO72_LG10g2583 [Vigna unguiculata]
MQNARQVGQKMELAPGSCSARQRDRTIARNWVGSGIDQGRRKLRFLGLGFLEQRGFGVTTMTPERGSGAGGYFWSVNGFQVVEQNCVCCDKVYGRQRLRDDVHQRCVAVRDDGCGMPVKSLCCARKGNGAVERCTIVVFKKENCLRWCQTARERERDRERVRVSGWEGFWGFWTGSWDHVEKRRAEGFVFEGALEKWRSGGAVERGGGGVKEF